MHRARDALGFDEDEMRRMMYQVELLGSREVVRWAVPLFFDTLDADIAARTRVPASKGDEAMDALDRSYHKFNQAVRAELGIPDPPPTRPPERIEVEHE